jgi:hypothetical protein
MKTSTHPRVSAYIIKINAVGAGNHVCFSAAFHELRDAKTRELIARRPTSRALRAIARKRGIAVIDGPIFWASPRLAENESFQS